MQVKKKIVFIIPSLEGGGSEKVLSILLKYMSLDVYDVTLAVVCKTGVYYDKLPDGIKKINLHATRNRYSAIKIYSFLRSTAPDLVVTFNVNHTYLNVFIASLFLPSRIKYIVRESTILSLVLKKAGLLSGFFLKHLYKLAYSRMTIMICQSSYMKMDLMENFKLPPKKAIVINNPLEAEIVLRLSHEDAKLFGSHYNVLAVGRLVHVKGFDLLINAFSKIRSSNIYLTILGEETLEDPSRKARLIELVKEHKLDDRISFLSFDPNPFKYMAQADLVVISSRFEGFPNVAIEANSLGKPVIAFRSPGGISDILMDGINGSLVAHGNTDDLAAAIENASVKEWNSASIKETTKKYDIRIIVPAYEKVFDNLIS